MPRPLPVSWRSAQRSVAQAARQRLCAGSGTCPAPGKWVGRNLPACPCIRAAQCQMAAQSHASTLADAGACDWPFTKSIRQNEWPTACPRCGCPGSMPTVQAVAARRTSSVVHVLLCCRRVALPEPGRKAQRPESADLTPGAFAACATTIASRCGSAPTGTLPRCAGQDRMPPAHRPASVCRPAWSRRPGREWRAGLSLPRVTLPRYAPCATFTITPAALRRALHERSEASACSLVEAPHCPGASATSSACRQMASSFAMPPGALAPLPVPRYVGPACSSACPALRSGAQGARPCSPAWSMRSACRPCLFTIASMRPCARSCTCHSRQLLVHRQQITSIECPGQNYEYHCGQHG